ncbi:hypothetical protein P8452_62380 [Trifolium repens]|nr:hypothetical protein P8452_62380 [Trifolium repens]
MAIFRTAVNMTRRRFSTGAGGAIPPPPPPHVPFLERKVGVRVDTLLLMMAGGVTAQIAFAIYPPLLDELARVTKGALARDDASED